MDLELSAGGFWLLPAVFGIWLPGAVASRRLFPGEGAAWHVGVGAALGLALFGAALLALDATPVGLSAGAVGTAVVILDLVALAVVATGWREARAWLSGRQAAPAALVAAIAVAGALLLPGVLEARPEPYSTFGIVEASDPAAPWLRAIPRDEEATIHSVVTSHEAAPTSYAIVLLSGGTVVRIFDLGVVRPGATVVQPITLPRRNAASQRFDLQLRRSGQETPYRSLFFWLKE